MVDYTQPIRRWSRVPERQLHPIDTDPEPGEVSGTVPSLCAVPTGSRVLLLNASFEPLAVVTAKRAIVLMLAGKAECVQTALEGAAFHSENLTLPWPSVMRLSRYVRVPYRRAVPMTRAGVLRRDLRRCAYCTRKADTIDHVVPRSRGGGHTWENCVAACRACNSKKADRLLEELGWTLKTHPRPPSRAAGGVLVLAVEPLPAWEPWLNVAA
jgi:5-methylcytosine-specific restriction endonuclease McrA